jgi:hypothetical protein
VTFTAAFVRFGRVCARGRTVDKTRTGWDVACGRPLALRSASPLYRSSIAPLQGQLCMPAIDRSDVRSLSMYRLRLRFIDDTKSTLATGRCARSCPLPLDSKARSRADGAIQVFPPAQVHDHAFENCLFAGAT